MYHYAGNNPVHYIDPDGRAVVTNIKYPLSGGNANDIYVVRAQTYFEKTVFEKLQAQVYPIKGDAIVTYSYLLIDGEYRIKEDNNTTSFTDIALTSISLSGDLKLIKGLEKAGKIAGWISNIKFAVDVLESYKNDVLNCAIEELTCDLFMYEMASDSPETSAKLYIFAKKEMLLLFNSGNINIDYDLGGGVINYIVKDPLDIEVIRNDLNNYKRDLKYGVPNE